MSNPFKPFQQAGYFILPLVIFLFHAHMCIYCTLVKWGRVVGDSMCPSCPEVLQPQENTCHTHTHYTNTDSPLKRTDTDMQVKCVTCDWAVKAREWWAPAATLNTSLPFRLFIQVGCGLKRTRKKSTHYVPL